MRQLARSTGFSLTAVRYALGKLEASGIVCNTSPRGRFSYKLTGRQVKARIPPHLRELAQALAREGGMTPVEAVHAFSAPAVTTRHRLKQLVRHGLAHERRRGWRLTYAPTLKLRAENGL